MPTAVCTRCALEKPHSEFRRNARARTGLSSWCATCSNEALRRWRAANQQRVGEYNAGRRKQPKQCLDCGAQIPGASRSGRCPECYAAHRKARRCGEWIKVPCCHCGEPVDKEARQVERYKVAFCDKSCAAKYRMARRPNPEPKPYRLLVSHWRSRPCRVCERPAWRTYCSDRCKNIYGNHGERARDALVCRECGHTWVRWQMPSRWQYCSDACSLRVQKRISKRKRRAALRAAKVEPVDLLRVAERDGWRCHICKRKVTRKTWSLDHLVPLSYGGEHSYANTALAHHRCNTLRSNTGAAQLRLAA